MTRKRKTKTKKTKEPPPINYVLVLNGVDGIEEIWGPSDTPGEYTVKWRSDTLSCWRRLVRMVGVKAK